MCGIAGVFTVERPVDADLVAAVLRMLDRQVHRGPNDWGILLPEAAARDGQVRALLEPRGWEHVRTYPGSAEAPAAILGTRRLSILDLSVAGRIPMGSPDGRVWVTYNGEIYNFQELRAELIARGYAFRSQGDTETLVHGYCEWGPDLVQRLRGMFAFGILDARVPHDPKLFLAKDRFGIKPLYWGRHKCVFQFASEVRALMAGGLMPSEPEPRGFHGFLVYGSVPTPWTTVRDVLSLPAAHALTLDEVSYSYPKPRRYWSLPAAGSLAISREEAVAETRRLLDESVRTHLVSDVPLGVFLSGGMDSSALAALASKHLPHPLTTLCVTFDEAELSEGEQAAASARRYGTKHVEVRLRGEDFVAEIPRILAAMDQPTIDGVNTYFVAKAAREAGLTVVLSGVGGDELFWGYPGFRRARWLRAVAAVLGSGFAGAAVGRVGRALGDWRIGKLAFLREHALLGPYLVTRGLFLPAEAARLLGAGRLPLWASDEYDDGSARATYARLEAQHYLHDQLLRDTDVFGMAHSLEIRVPFLDHRLAELVFALPETYLLSSTINKPMLAAALRDEYPAEMLTRKKMGFTFPIGKWMRGAWDEIDRHTAHPEPIEAQAAAGVIGAVRRERLHWSRGWALAVFRGMSRRGALAPWNPVSGPAATLWLIPEAYASKGGVQLYLQHLLRATAENLPRCAMTVVSVNDARMPEEASLAGRVDFRAVGPRRRRGHKARLVLAILAAAMRSRHDLVVCGHLNLSPLAWLAGVLTRSPVVLVVYGIEVCQRPSSVKRMTARRARRVLAISRFTGAQLAGWYGRPGRLSILPNAVDGETFRPVGALPRGGPRLLTVARLARSEGYKGVDRVLRSLPAIRERFPGVRYLVVGDGDDLPRLRSLAASLGVDASVDFLGFVPDDRVPGLYSGADLFVMPSAREGFGFVFLEALACGTPVVAGSSDGSVDALLEGRLGSLVPPDDLEALTGAVLAALEQPRRESCLDSCRDRRAKVLEAYGFERFRRRVNELFSMPGPARGDGPEWPAGLGRGPAQAHVDRAGSVARAVDAGRAPRCRVDRP
jgi:asparagine synthase (glutamine-hydrolysing)